MDTVKKVKDECDKTIRLLTDENGKLKKQTKTIVENNLESMNKIKKENEALQHRMFVIMRCEVCDLGFESKALLMNYIEDHFKKKYGHNSKKVRCTHCEKLFRNKDDLKKHLWAKHEPQFS